MNTDVAWEEWGRSDPYYGVITDPRFRLAELTPHAKQEFFESGRLHADYVMQMIKQHIEPAFNPSTILDFGCGVGRLLIPFGGMATRVTGMDVSSSMLLETARNCAKFGVENADLVVSDDELTLLRGHFDLIHSFIVFQHIPVSRGRAILEKLLDHLTPHGIGAIHFSYAKTVFSSTYGSPLEGLRSSNSTSEMSSQVTRQPGEDPEMQMNSYPLNDLLFILQAKGVQRFHAEFTNHGGELGVFLFFRKP